MYVYLYMYVCVCVRACVRVCVCVCVYVYIYVYIYIICLLFFFKQPACSDPTLLRQVVGPLAADPGLRLCGPRPPVRFVLYRQALKSPHIVGLFHPYSRSLLTLVWSAQLTCQSLF